MKAKVLNKLIKKEFDNYEIDCEITNKDENLTEVIAEVILGENEVPLTVFGNIFKGGLITIDFIFNKAKDFEDMFELINNINENSIEFKAYIDEDDNFILNFTSFAVDDEKVMANLLGYSLSCLIDDEHTEMLKPIVAKLEK